MTTLPSRPNTALLIIDVQQGVVRDVIERDAFLANVGTLAEKARDAGVPVVWVQHSDEQLVQGSDDWRFLPELAPAGEDTLVPKNWGDAFEETSLEAVLADRGVGRLLSPARRPTRASARRCTARSSGATTRCSSAMPTARRTRRHGERRRPTR